MIGFKRLDAMQLKRHQFIQKNSKNDEVFDFARFCTNSKYLFGKRSSTEHLINLSYFTYQQLKSRVSLRATKVVCSALLYFAAVILDLSYHSLPIPDFTIKSVAQKSNES